MIRPVLRLYLHTCALFSSSGRWARRGRRATTTTWVFLLPLVNDAPYNGNPAPEEAAELDALLDWHLLLDVLVRVSDTESLLRIPQMDWPEGRNKRPKKAKYLTTLKSALSGFQVEWASWRRFSDLPILKMQAPVTVSQRQASPAEAPH